VASNWRHKKVLFIIAGTGVVLFLAAVFFVLTFDVNAFKPRIEAKLSATTGMEVRIGRLGFALFPEMGISARNIVIQNEGERIASAEAIYLRIELLPLLHRQLRVRRVTVVSPEIVVVRDKEGHYNFERRRKTAGTKPFEIQLLRVRGGHIVYTDEGTGGRTEAAGCDSEARDVSGGPDDLWHTVSFEGGIACREVRTKGLAATEVKAGIRALTGRYEASPVEMKIYGGEGRGDATVDAREKSPSWSVGFSITGFRFEKVLEAFGKSQDIRGILNLKGHLTMEGKNRAEMKKTMRGEVSIRGQDLLFEKFDLDRLLEKYEESQNFNLIDVGGFFVLGPLSSLLTKGYEFGGVYAASHGGRSTIRRLVSDWKVDNGIADAKDVAFVTDRNRVAMKGRLDFVRDRFVGVTVAVLNAKGCAVYRQSIRGPFRKPVVEKPGVIRSFLSPVVSLLKKPVELLAGERCEVFYRGSLPQPGK
jgi:uncharacterized protein involved in outer membrane biogenesis